MAISEINDKSLAASAVNLATTTVTGILPAANTVANLSPGNNLVINGAMQIWQRGVSQTTTGYGCVDRFKNYVSGTVTFSQETTGLPSGFVYALKWTTGAATSYGQSRHFIETENVKALRGKTLTASAYVKVSSTYSGVATWEIYYSTGGDVSGSSWANLNPTNVISASASDASSDYKRISCNVTIPANAVGIYVGIVPSAVQASGVTCSMTGVQLESGTVATPFNHRSYGQELALCQRYYYVFGGEGAAPNIQGYGKGGDNTFGFTYPTNMRASPSGATSGTWQKSNCGDPVLVHQSSRQFSVRVSVSSQGNYEFYPASGSGKIELSAEL